MKANFKNTTTTILVLCTVAFICYYYFSESPSVESNLTPENPKSNVSVIPSTLRFNLPSFTTNQVLARPFYTLSYNDNAEQADWVAYTLYPLADSLRVERKDNFRADPDILTGSATLADYKSSGYDRGHLAPARALSYSNEAMSASFYMSNMSPQIGIGFNRGIWKFIEAKVFEWSNSSDSLYVVTGPILDKPLGTIGESKVIIPRAYYKTIVRFKEGNIFGIGFLIKHAKYPKTAKPYDFITSIDSVEKVSGINFYHQMDTIMQLRVEANKELSTFINE